MLEKFEFDRVQFTNRDEALIELATAIYGLSNKMYEVVEELNKREGELKELYEPPKEESMIINSVTCRATNKFRKKKVQLSTWAEPVVGDTGNVFEVLQQLFVNIENDMQGMWVDVPVIETQDDFYYGEVG